MAVEYVHSSVTFRESDCHWKPREANGRDAKMSVMRILGY